MTTTTTEEAAHVGTLNPEDKKSQNLEGKLLSVCHPSDVRHWREIARLGDTLTHLAKGPFELVDVLGSDAPMDWAQGKEYLKTAEVHEVVTYRKNRSNGLLRFMEREKANKAFYHRLSDGKGASIRTTEALIGTEKLYKKRNRISAPRTFPKSAVWVQYVLSKDIDGLWWREAHDPSQMSCPRGGLHPNHISEFEQVRKSELR